MQTEPDDIKLNDILEINFISDDFLVLKAKVSVISIFENARGIKQQLSNLLSKKNIKYLLFDFEKVVYIDSTTAGLIFSVNHELKRNKGQCFIIVKEQQVVGILSILNIFNLVTRVDSVSEIILDR